MLRFGIIAGQDNSDHCNDNGLGEGGILLQAAQARGTTQKIRAHI